MSAHKHIYTVQKKNTDIIIIKYQIYIALISNKCSEALRYKHTCK